VLPLVEGGRQTWAHILPVGVGDEDQGASSPGTISSHKVDECLFLGVQDVIPQRRCLGEQRAGGRVVDRLLPRTGVRIG